MKIKQAVILGVSTVLISFACIVSGNPFSAGTPSPEPTEIDPNTIVLHWTRIGGIAGFCDDLSITADGRGTAVSCSESFIPEPVLLPQEQVFQLQTWMAAFGTIVDGQTDDGVADSMTVTLEFFGYGSAAPTGDDIQTLRNFAAETFAQLHAPLFPTPTGDGPCTATAITDVNVYSRPDPSANFFGTLAAGDSVLPTNRSVDGWLGFDPGVAQAGNVGVFRNRWVLPDENLSVSGDCAGLPLAPVISPTACYTMALFDTPVYAAPDSTSSIVLTLAVEGYAAVTARNTAGWLQVDLNDSSQPLAADGWVDPASINFNGPCDSLPELP